MKLQFLGATRTVTGSCYLLEVNGLKILIDCGMFQGVGVEDRNYKDFDFNPHEIDFVVLTHSHLDHCGLLPKLYKEGFAGKLFMTIPTREIVENMLLDSAKVQEIKYRDSKRVKKQRIRRKDDDLETSSIIYPMYDTRDVIDLLDKCAETCKYCLDINLGSGISFKFLRVGHALGAASVLFSIKEVTKGFKRILFSGDIGNSQQELDNRFDYAKEADYVVMESLYGGEEHEERKKTIKDFSKAISDTLNRGGNVLIPSFTYQRSQEMLYILKKLLGQDKIPSKTKVFLDSPLAIRITDIYKKYFRYLNQKVIKIFKDGNRLFTCKNFVFTSKPTESKGINKVHNSIIIAGHGMCAGGRILHHIYHNISDTKSSILFVGYQAEGTLGREILDGAKEVSLNNKRIPVNSEVYRYSSFSAHAGNNDLVNWLSKVKMEGIRQIYLVHAEEKRSVEFRDILKRKGYNDIVIPKWKEIYDLN